MRNGLKAAFGGPTLFLRGRGKPGRPALNRQRQTRGNAEDAKLRAYPARAARSPGYRTQRKPAMSQAAACSNPPLARPAQLVPSAPPRSRTNRAAKAAKAAKAANGVAQAYCLLYAVALAAATAALT